MKKLTLKEIDEILDFEDKCGVANLIQEIFAHPDAKTGIDVIEDDEGVCSVVKGTTLKVKETK